MVKAALISVIPVVVEGIPYSELVDLVESKLTQDELDYLGSVSWYMVTVKLDLEARNILQRVPNQKPQKARRIRQNQ